MRGLQHTAEISEHIGGEWVDIAATWKCRLQPVSGKVNLEYSRYPQATHLAIGEGTPAIEEGMRLVIRRGTVLQGTFYVNGVQKMERPGVGRHHQEVFLSEAKV